MSQSLPSSSPRDSATALTVAPLMHAASTCASNRAVKCEFGRTSHGMSTVLTPCSGQSVLGTAQCT